MKVQFDGWKTQREQAQDCGVLRVYRYSSEKHNCPVVMLFKPKAIKPYAHYRFNDNEKMETYIQGQIANMQKYKNMVQERKEERKGTQEQIDNVKIGDIFHHSWGYDQTNVDYYQVIEKNGRMLTLREVAAVSVGKDGFMCDHCIAGKDQFKGEPFTKLLQFSGKTPYITISSYGWCSLWDGKENYRSWYA